MFTILKIQVELIFNNSNKNIKFIINDWLHKTLYIMPLTPNLLSLDGDEFWLAAVCDAMLDSNAKMERHTIDINRPIK